LQQVFLQAFIVVCLALREIGYTSAVIEVAAEQKVITTGPDAVVINR
jgi:hypothetical protein